METKDYKDLNYELAWDKEKKIIKYRCNHCGSEQPEKLLRCTNCGGLWTVY